MAPSNHVYGHRRLTSSDGTSYSYSYSYDRVGNRTDGGRTYNAANEVVGFTYDDAGNLLNDGSTSYTYDALGRLTQQGGTSYASNGDGVLVGRGSTSYTQDLVAPLEQVLNDGTTNAIYGLARIRRGTSTWYQHDGLGSVRAVLDGAGAVQSTTSYDPWGTPQTALTDSFGFTGELHDGDLVHLRARWYHPSTGTFTSRDPFAGFDTQPYSLHPYQYAYSVPTTWSDPSGRNPACALGLAGGPPGWGAAAACAALWAVGAYVVTALAVEVGKAAAEQCDRTDCLNGLTPPRRPARERIDAGAAPAPPRHTGNHTPAPVTPPSSPHTAPQDVPRGGNIQGTPWEMDESLVCEAFPLPEADDFKVTIFPAPQEGEVPVLLAQEGGTITNYTPADQVAFEQFIQEATVYQANRGYNSLNQFWPLILQMYPTDDIYLYKQGDQVKAALAVRIVEINGMTVLSIDAVEGIQHQAGRILRRSALERSLAENLDGVIGAPLSQSLDLYVRYGAVPFDEDLYFLERSKIQQALSRLPEE